LFSGQKQTQNKERNGNKMVSKIAISKNLMTDIQTRILALLGKKNGSWNGSMSELNTAITTSLRRGESENWPSSPSVMRRAINTITPMLRRAGISVKFGRETDHFRKRYVNFVQN
jgi:hypothetical protein